MPWRKELFRRLRGKLRAMTLSAHGVAVIADTQNGLLAVDPRDFGVARALLATGSYDFASVRWLLKLLGADSRMVFVGAHVGALLVPLAVQSGSRHVHAFEPSPGNRRLLQMSLALNGLPHVIVHPMAAGDSVGVVQLTENRTNTGNSRVSETQGGIAVQMTTLDAALPADWSHTDLLFIDAEGSEAQVLRGAMRSLAKTRYLYVEYAPEQLLEQGNSATELIELIAGQQFQSMYLPGTEVRFFAGKTYVQYLQSLPSRRGLLLNLLFTKDSAPAPEMLVM